MTTLRGGLNDYSVWARNIFNLRDNEKLPASTEFMDRPLLPEWTEEFRGSRADCLRYLDHALIDVAPDGHGHRNWTFAISPPGEGPMEPLD